MENLEDARRNEAFLRKKNKELLDKIKDLEEKLEGSGDNAANTALDINFEKHCDNDKVIKSINRLMISNQEDLAQNQQEEKRLTGEQTKADSKVKETNEELDKLAV